MNILITGCAGFIGFHTSLRFLYFKNNKVFGLDNLNAYYDINLKKKRLALLKKNKNFTFFKENLGKKDKLFKTLDKIKIDIIINLAAQAGVRYSLTNPQSYLESNVVGFFNILELSRQKKIKHLVFASTSSVYGDCNKFPIREEFNTDKPLSFYAATKKTNEIMAHSYSVTYGIKCTALRFFTVYGPFGRPDMALYKFVESAIKGKKVYLFNKGNHFRDFTYVDDIVESIFKLVKLKSKTKFNILNIGRGKTESLKKYIKIIENILGKKINARVAPLQVGDVYKTHSDINKLKKLIDYKPSVNIEKGIKKFIEWYVDYI
tara:strand:+ start:2554 stop:3510 length:957 start_codon:yes stop_codon:yes gene_type:complete